MQTKIVRTEVTENGKSYQIDFDGVLVWFDTWQTDDGLTGDWNKYIFHDNNEEDQKIKAIQDACNDEVGAYNYATALELAEQAQYCTECMATPCHQV